MRWFQLGVVGSLTGVIGLFAWQNSLRTTQLSLDLWVAAWELQRPVPIPALIGGCVLAGALLAGVPMWLRSLRLSSRVRDLESQQAMGQALGTRDGSGREPGAW